MEMPAAGDPTTTFGSLRLTGRISQLWTQRERESGSAVRALPVLPLLLSLLSQKKDTGLRRGPPARPNCSESFCLVGGGRCSRSRRVAVAVARGPGCVLRLRYNITTGDFRPTSLAAGEGPATNQPRPRKMAAAMAAWAPLSLCELSLPISEG